MKNVLKRRFLPLDYVYTLQFSYIDCTIKIFDGNKNFMHWPHGGDYLNHLKHLQIDTCGPFSFYSR